MDEELEGCMADARIAISAAHDHLTRIEERARKVSAAVQREMGERIATAERERDEARSALTAALASGQAARDQRDEALRQVDRLRLDLRRGINGEAP